LTVFEGKSSGLTADVLGDRRYGVLPSRGIEGRVIDVLDDLIKFWTLIFAHGPAN
jgi:hypothetical protein